MILEIVAKDSANDTVSNECARMAGNSLEICAYVPGALGRVTQLHGEYYHGHWGFDLYFESLVAVELAGFLGRMHPARDGFWLARVDGVIAGSISVDGSLAADDAGGGEGARLRWFILDPAYHGRGIGGRLMEEAMAFCDRAGFARVFLWTFAGLDAARALYEQSGFKLCREHEDDRWGKPVTEQLFERFLK